MAYVYNEIAGRALRDWQLHATLPPAWPYSEQKFQYAVNVEVSPITGEAYAAWIFDQPNKTLCLYLCGDTDWTAARPTSVGQISTFPFPPTGLIKPEMSGCGRGWGLYSDQVIEAAEILHGKKLVH